MCDAEKCRNRPSWKGRLATGVLSTMEGVARFPGRQFRTILRLMCRGMYLESAHALLRYRARHADLELLADDVNAVLSATLQADATKMMVLFLAAERKAGRLSALWAAQRECGGAVAAFNGVLEAWDLGAFPDLAGAVYMRSREVHEDRSAAKRAAEAAAGGGGGGGGGGAGDGDGSAGVKRARAADDGAAPAAEAATAAAAAATAAAAAAAAEAAASSDEFKQLSAALQEGALGPAAAPRWAEARWRRAERMFGALGTEELRGVAPNARSYVLMLHGALARGDVARGKALLAAMVGEGEGGGGGGASSGASSGGAPPPPPPPPPACARGELYTVMQPAMLHALAGAGILPAPEVAALLSAPPDTPKWFFLKAAYEAHRGDQHGAKHGAVLTQGGRYLAHGHNHRFGVPGDKHLRVMHSEVHAFVRLPAAELAAGGELWIVELDGLGLGYEEAVACVMCNKGMARLGVGVQHFSSHAGVRTLRVGSNPALTCESYELAKRRVYPEGTTDPDAGEERGFDFGAVEDPGRRGKKWHWGRGAEEAKPESGRGEIGAPV